MIKSNTWKAIGVAALFATTAMPSMAETITEKFSVSAETSQHRVDYSPIDGFVKAFCTETSRRVQCAYDAMGQQGKVYMARYENYLERIPVSQLSKNDQLAFWLNTRNMMVVHAIAESKSRRSLKAARGTFAEPGKMWTEKRITIEGVELSIHDIEKEIILANWDNPNVIYGLYQGSRGGPAMPAAGFDGNTVNATLEELGQSFVNSNAGLRVRKDKANVNAIYDWYGDAVFGGDDAALKTHLASLATGKRASGLQKASSFTTAKFSYNVDNYVIRQQSPAAGGFGGGVGGGGGGAAGGS